MRLVRYQLRALILIGVALIANVATAAMLPPTVLIDHLQLAPMDLPQNGTLDISLSSIESGFVPLAGFQLSVSLVGPDNAVRFTNVLGPQSHPYLFAPTSMGPLFTISADGLQAMLGDFLDTGIGQAVNGTGLATLQVVVDPAASGKTYDLVISLEPTDSFLAMDANNFVAFSTENGSVTIVPEPQGMLLVASLVLLTPSFRHQCSLCLRRWYGVACFKSGGSRFP